MEQLKHYQQVIELGKKISNDFLTHEDRNITAKWVANYISGLILVAENEPNDERKKQNQKECYEAILKLWEKRAELPRRLQPLSNLENVIDVLNSLIENNKKFGWFAYDEINDKGPWGRFIVDMRECYKDAIELSICASVLPEYLEKSKEWLEQENLLSEQETKIIRRLEFLLTKSDTRLMEIYLGEKKEIPQQKDKKTEMIERIEKLVERQNKALGELKKAIETGTF